MTIFRLPNNLTIYYEIRTQISELKSVGIQPTIVRLSRRASVQYAFETGSKDGRISNAPNFFIGPNCLCYINYRDPFIRWVWLEGISAELFNNMVKNGVDVLNLFYNIY